MKYHPPHYCLPPISFYSTIYIFLIILSYFSYLTWLSPLHYRITLYHILLPWLYYYVALLYPMWLILWYPRISIWLSQYRSTLPTTYPTITTTQTYSPLYTITFLNMCLLILFIDLCLIKAYIYVIISYYDRRL